MYLGKKIKEQMEAIFSIGRVENGWEKSQRETVPAMSQVING
jgi:hypothetical protein